MKYAIGLMSGTSLDGADAALVRSDGESRVEAIAFEALPFERGLRDRLRLCLGGNASPAEIAEAERDLTLYHVPLVEALLEKSGLARHEVSVIGFHGQTLLHAPEQGRTWQIGDGRLLADSLGIDVINDFRSADMAAGGQGAPFAPLYHAARAADLELPLAVLSIGGVANVTWVSFQDGIDHPRLLAFDTGPGSALLDDWAEIHTGTPCDTDGLLAARGTVHPEILTGMMDSPYFDEAPPKSLDRDDFTSQPARGLSAADGAATLTAFTVAAAVAAQAHFPMPPEAWYVCGGGRHNRTLMTQLRERFPVLVEPVDVLGLRGDFLEAEAFGFLAARALRGLPLSYPSTTGVGEPLTGGVVHRP